jgi:hypothetical protein
MRKTWLVAALALAACQESRGPVTPDPANESVATEPLAATAACPCWDAGRLVTAFPAVHYFLEAAHAASLTRFAHADAQQIQAIVRYETSSRGTCELATFGTEGLVETIASANDLSEAACDACAALLGARASASGFGTPALQKAPVR